MKTIKVFAPATVANLSCGFDVLGCCLESIGDEMVLTENSENKLRISKIEGQELPFEIDLNVAGVAMKALLKEYGSDQGFDLEIYKNIKPGSGIGSSAASAAGAVFALNKLLGEPFSRKELVNFAMQGEMLASGHAHADNVAPALVGGFTLIRSYEPLEVISLPVPEKLKAVVLHPKIEVKTKDSRGLIKDNVSLDKAVKNWGNVGALVNALHTDDYKLLGRSLHDEIVEPIRSILIPYFKEMKETALNNGALGFGISGSGPSVYALCEGDEVAEQVRQSLTGFYSAKNIEFDIYKSNINPTGVREL